MAKPNWSNVKERLNAVQNELARLMRAVDDEIIAADQPEMVSVSADELRRLRGETSAEDASKAAARQSVAAGNADSGTRAQAAAAKAEESKK